MTFICIHCVCLICTALYQCALFLYTLFKLCCLEPCDAGFVMGRGPNDFCAMMRLNWGSLRRPFEVSFNTTFLCQRQEADFDRLLAAVWTVNWDGQLY